MLQRWSRRPFRVAAHDDEPPEVAEQFLLGRQKFRASHRQGCLELGAVLAGARAAPAALRAVMAAPPRTETKTGDAHAAFGRLTDNGWAGRRHQAAQGVA